MEWQFELPYISITGAAKHLGISPLAVIMLVKKGDLPDLVLVGNRMLFETDELKRWERENHV